MPSLSPNATLSSSSSIVFTLINSAPSPSYAILSTQLPCFKSLSVFASYVSHPSFVSRSVHKYSIESATPNISPNATHPRPSSIFFTLFNSAPSLPWSNIFPFSFCALFLLFPPVLRIHFCTSFFCYEVHTFEVHSNSIESLHIPSLSPNAECNLVEPIIHRFHSYQFCSFAVIRNFVNPTSLLQVAFRLRLP